MRQLIIQVPRGEGQRAFAIVQTCQGANLMQFQAEDEDGPTDVVLAHVSNRQLDDVLKALEDIPEARVATIPQDVFIFRPATTEMPQQAREVEERSVVEIYLEGLQSISSWRGFLGYTVAAALLVWIGLFTNSIILLIGAMLIAPYAGPAMNVAIASARGDSMLLRHAVLRYFVALVITIVIAGAATLLLQQEIITPQMINTSQVSAVAALQPLIAGAGGALTLVQSSRSSLVSGTATGVLVAASLAPPAGMIGMASVLGEWGMVRAGVFLVLLQLVGINLAGMIVFRLYKLSPQRSRYDRGRRWLFPVSLGVSIVLMAGLLVWQFVNAPDLQRSSRSQQASAEIREVIDDSPLVDLVEVAARFTRAEEGQNTLLGVVYVQRRAHVTTSAEDIRAQLTRAIQGRLLEAGFNVTPLIDVSVLDPPPAAGSE
ncbi:MAG: DUF389 domain-containing protein [Chloroflexi bacterium]|nr:DUF389 domain-containing protein [Chloroflexota bacterium]